MEDSNFSLIPAQNSGGLDIERSISAFNQPLAELLSHAGLPVENVLSPIEERRKVIVSLSSVLELIPIDERAKSFYLSKFTVAITAGLFDGALTFLWDEAVKALRRLVASFDLQYFYSIAESTSPRYRGLSSEEELEAISEHDLLEICRRIGLINDVNHKRLAQVNYFRNHASAAHPNEHEISGIEILSYLEHCIKYAILSKPDHSVIQVKRLLDNIRVNIIPPADFQVIGSDLQKQPQERIDDFVASIFGLFCDTRQNQNVKNNIVGIIPFIWPLSSEDKKYMIGSKYGTYRKNGDIPRKDAADYFLSIVQGQKYKDEDSLAGELIEKCQQLRAAHFGMNNFYNEYQHALEIDTSLPPSGIPRAAKRDFVKVICLCYIGNGHGYREGVDERALPYYEKYINIFGEKEIQIFLSLYTDPEFTIDIHKQKPDSRARYLSNLLKNKTNNVILTNGLDMIIGMAPLKLEKIKNVKTFKDILSKINLA